MPVRVFLRAARVLRRVEADAQKMSTVRLSDGSPTRERMETRPADQPKPSACRNLFGPVDRDALRQDFQRHMKAMEDASADAWNFDFRAHTPRPGGRYQWEALDIRPVPGFYSSSARRKGSGANVSSGNNNDKVDINGNHECRVTASAETPETPGDPRKERPVPTRRVEKSAHTSAGMK